jgi:transposase InsO family protein
MGEIVKRAGLVVARKKQRRTEPCTHPLQHAVASNRVWRADFKGWFRAGDGKRVDPLTITDACSRYLLRSQAVEKTDTERVRAIFEAAFREYGLPEGWGGGFDGTRDIEVARRNDVGLFSGGRLCHACVHGKQR